MNYKCKDVIYNVSTTIWVIGHFIDQISNALYSFEQKTKLRNVPLADFFCDKVEVNYFLWKVIQVFRIIRFYSLFFLNFSLWLALVFLLYVEPVKAQINGPGAPEFEEDVNIDFFNPGIPVFPDNQLPLVNVDPVVFYLDNKFATDYESYLDIAKGERINLEKAREILVKIEKAAGVKPGIIYASFIPVELDVSSSQNQQIIKRNQFELVLITAKGKPIRKTIHTASQQEIYNVAKEFYKAVEKPGDNSYEAPAQKLYQWMVKPLEDKLKEREINNLLFITDEKLRSVPLAALHDGKQFLVEKYSIGFTPSLSLTKTEYKDVKKSHILAMGASEFENNRPLPAVKKEISAISQIWNTESYLNEDFTLTKLKSSKKQFGIIHLATHGNFGKSPEDSFIEFKNKKLNLNQFGDLKFNEPTVELLVLSACQTSSGNREAELGFGGLAVKTGAKTALASLWNVDDYATFGLMSEFYHQLKEAPIKSEALQKAQIAMLKGEIWQENGKLYTARNRNVISMEVVQPKSQPPSPKLPKFTHPYYWAAFTMIGNPW